MNEQTNPVPEASRSESAAAAAGLLESFVAVITRPAAFFDTMERDGGYGQPLLFMVAMGAAAGLLRAVLGILGLLPDTSVTMALAGIVLAPILVGIFGFLGAAVLYLIWKLMGSGENFETAYRCTAYGSAISPLTQLFLVVPYLGIVLDLAWWTLILVLASTRVHHIRQGVAAAGFGALAVILAFTGISAQLAARRMEGALSKARSQLQSGNPQDAAQAAQALQQLLQSAGQNAQRQTSGK